MPHSEPASANAPLREQVRTEVARWIAAAQRLFPGLRLPEPRIRFDLRGLGAGQAQTQPWRWRRHPDVIRLNPVLLESHPQEMLGETVPHEIAHLVVARRFGRRAAPHGPEWRAVMTAFDVPARPCHAMPAEPARRLRRYRYRCACPEGVELSSIRHNRARRGTRYVCRRCGETLRWAGE